MFNWGGPVKEGIMHGIREPHFRGKIVGSAMPHIQRGWQAFKNIFGKTAPGTRTVPRQGPPYNIPGGSQYSKGYPGPKVPGQNVGPGSVEVTKQIFTPKPWAKKSWEYLKESPEGKITGWLWSGKGWVPKIAKGAVKSPLVAAGLTYTGVKWVWPDGTEATDAEVKNIMKPGGYPGGDKKTTKEAQADFAKTQRDTRVQRYLDLMGYDRAKKTAIADALIDASKIVSDRGTLDRKNITGELINPAIQALSKRLDKPDQIREAVGLMMVKGEIEKDLEDPTVKALRLEQYKKLKGGFEKDLGDLLLSTKGSKVTKGTLEKYARVKANEYGLPFTLVDETTVMGTEPGVYMVEDKIFRVDENGQATQVV